MSDMQERILAFLAKDGYKLSRSRELAADLGVPDDDYRVFRNTLRELKDEGRVVRRKGGKWSLSFDEVAARAPLEVAGGNGRGAARRKAAPAPDRASVQQERHGVTLLGVVEVKRGGFGFFVSEDATQEDLFIPENDLNGAMNGDRVTVEIVRGGSRRGALESARVVEIVERAVHRIVCRVLRGGATVLCDPEDPRIQAYFNATLAEGVSAFPDDKVLVEITEYPMGGGDGEGVIIDRLGPAGEPTTEIAAILGQFDVPTEFPEDVLAEVREMAMTISADERARRHDLTDMLCVTIDPVDARDFDDAISVSKTEHGYRLGVHIADVSHFVRTGTALDREARNRSTSIYLPGRVIPMLPPELSNDLCSLRPNEERFALSVFMDVSEDGEVSHPECSRSIIKSRRRLTYEQAYALLSDDATAEGFDDKDVLSTVRMIRTMAGLLRTRRMREGSIELCMPEYKVMVDEHGEAVGMIRVEYDVTHQMVEDCMLAANVAMAQYAAKRHLPVLYRVHDEPESESIETLAEFLDACGYRLSLPMTRKGLNKILEAVREKPEEYSVNLAVLTSMKQAQYVPQVNQHFALGFQKYTHFTSPIRRYPDLWLHQQLKACMPENDCRLPEQSSARGGEGASVELVALGMHASARERQAMKVEGDVVNFRRLELLRKCDKTVHHARITGIRSFGVFVSINDFFVEAMLSRDELAAHGIATESFLPNAEERFQRGKKPSRRTEGRKARGGFHLGEEVLVEVKKIDMATRSCEIGFIGRAGEYHAQ